jgi:hypothetical protein
MKKLVVFSLISILSAFTLMGCQRGRGVEASYQQGNSGTYQPRLPAATKGEAQHKPNQDVKGELHRVDLAGKTIAVRVENGIEQTFKFDDNTSVTGLEGQAQANAPAKAGKAGNSAIGSLAGKEGSEVTVMWREHKGAKMATRVNVTQVSTTTNARRGRKR